jgi:hypothetical protein
MVSFLEPHVHEARSVMSEPAELKPFFERDEESKGGFPAEKYVASYRRPDGTAAVEITLPAEAVERTVLTGARLSLWLSLDGHLVLDGEGLSDKMLEAANTAGAIRQQTLTSLVAASLDPDYLDGEDDPVAELGSLKAQLVDAVAKVDGAIERLKQRGGLLD